MVTLDYKCYMLDRRVHTWHGPRNNHSYSETKERWSNESSEIGSSPDVDQMMKDRSDVTGSFVDVLLLVLYEIRHGIGKGKKKKQWPDTCPTLRDRCIANLESLIAAEKARESNELSNDVELKFLWEDEPPAPLKNDEFEELRDKLESKKKKKEKKKKKKKKGKSDALRGMLRALHHFYSEEEAKGGHCYPPRFRQSPKLTKERNLERRGGLADHAARSYFDMLYHDHKAEFHPFLSQDQVDNPDKVPVEEKKTLVLHCLWNMGVVRRNYIPAYLLSREKIALNARDVEKKRFWMRATPIILARVKEVNEELKKRKEDVSS